jgi:hypothetical protein
MLNDAEKLAIDVLPCHAYHIATPLACVAQKRQSNAKDYAYEVIVVGWRRGAMARLQPAAAGLGGSERPLREQKMI